MITIKLFAMLREKAGQDELHIDSSASTLSELLKEVSSKYPALSNLISCGKILTSVNQEFVKGDAPVKDGDEVALMPPFSGGGGTTGHVCIQKEPFSLDNEIERLKQSSPSIGAIVTFLGTTRDISKGRQVATARVRTLSRHGGEKTRGDQGAGDQGIRGASMCRSFTGSARCR